MSTAPTLLAVIPARSGSKGIVDKNLATVAGRPLIAYTIDAARQSRAVTRTVVSTDALDIADVARSLGADVPFLRPAELARDDTPGIAPFVHAVSWLGEAQGFRPDWVLLLQPTSPLRTAEDIDAAVALAIERDADAVLSVCPVRHHPYWTRQLEPDGRLTPFIEPDPPALRRQDLPEVMSLNGAIYLIRRDVLLAGESFDTDRTLGYVMPPERSLDVDTPWDLQLVEWALRARET